MPNQHSWPKWAAPILLSAALLSACGVTPSAKSDASQTAGASASAGGVQAEMDWSKLGDGSQKGKKITVLMVDTDGRVAQMAKKFTEETGIEVNFMGVDYNSLFGKITTASLSSSSDIDIIEMDTIWGGQFYEGKIAADLTNVMPKEILSNYTQSSVDSVIYNGHVLAIPYYSSSKHLYWNKKLLADAGYDAPPKTWDEFREMSKKLTKDGVYGSAWSWKQAESLNIDFDTIVAAFGGKLLDDQGKLHVNSKEAVQALTYMTDLLHVDKTVDPSSLQWTEDDVKNAFSAGKIAMMINWEGMYPDLNNAEMSQVVGQTDVGLIPGQGDIKSTAVSGSEGIGIMQSSKNKQAALEFVKWIGEKGFQLDNFKEMGIYPSLKSLYEDPDMIAADSTETLGKIVEQFQYGSNRPNAPGYVEWADIQSNEIYSALVKNKTPQQALDDAAKKIDQAIQRAAK